MKAATNKKSPFTLIELLIVISIIGILMAILLPAISGSINEGRETQLQSELNRIGAAVIKYHADYQKYPSAIDDLKKNSSENPRAISYYDGDGKTPWGEDITLNTTSDPISVEGLTYDGDTLKFEIKQD